MHGHKIIEYIIIMSKEYFLLVLCMKIREARRARVRPPPDEGTKIILRLNSDHANRIGRLFDKNALFQVYLKFH